MLSCVILCLYTSIQKANPCQTEDIAQYQQKEEAFRDSNCTHTHTHTHTICYNPPHTLTAKEFSTWYVL